MTYEEKFNLIILALIEAKKLARKEYHPKLYTTNENINKINIEEVYDILLKLQDDEKVLTIKDIPTKLKPLTKQTDDLLDPKNYFLIDCSDSFEDWYENYLLKQKSGISEMTYLNLLRLFDVMLAIKEKVQLNREKTVIIPLLPPRIYFQELLPYDTPGVRDEYIEGRWEAVKYLHKEGILSEFKHIDSMMHRWITKDKYEEKRKEYRAKQREIKEKMNKLHFADEEYYLTSEYLIKLAQNASKLFESSEVHEKRLFLKMILKNLTLARKKVRYNWLNLFDKTGFYASRQAWLPRQVSNLEPCR